MNYGDLIKDALRISWRNKFLWFFGIFVAGGNAFSGCGSGGGGGGSGDSGGEFQSSGEVSQASLSTVEPRASLAQLAPQFQMEENAAALIIAGVVVVVLLALVSIFLAVVASGGMAESVAAMDRGEERRFDSTFRAGLSSFWRVLGQAVLYFLTGLAFLAATALVLAAPFGLTFLLTESAGARIAVGVSMLAVWLLLFIVFLIPYGVVGQFALRRLVLGGEGMFAAIKGGYRLFRANLGSGLLVWLINFGISIGLFIALLIVFLVLGVILFLPSILLAISELFTAAIIAGIVSALIFLPVFLAIYGAAKTFSHAYWTLAYLRLTGPNSPASEPGAGVRAA